MPITWFTSTEAPIFAKSSLHPVVIFVAMAAIVSFVHDPVLQIPFNQLSIVFGTDASEPTTKANTAEGFRQAASGDVRSPFREAEHDEERSGNLNCQASFKLTNRRTTIWHGALTKRRKRDQLRR